MTIGIINLDLIKLYEKAAIVEKDVFQVYEAIYFKLSLNANKIPDYESSILFLDPPINTLINIYTDIVVLSMSLVDSFDYRICSDYNPEGGELYKYIYENIESRITKHRFTILKFLNESNLLSPKFSNDFSRKYKEINSNLDSHARIISLEDLRQNMSFILPVQEIIKQSRTLQ